MSPQTFFFSLSKFSFFLTPPHSRLYFQFHHVVSVTRPSLSARRTAPSSLSFSFSQKAENSAGKSPEDSSASLENQVRKRAGTKHLFFDHRIEKQCRFSFLFRRAFSTFFLFSLFRRRNRVPESVSSKLQNTLRTGASFHYPFPANL